MDDCIFCKICDGEIPSEFVHKDKDCIAFKDINPQERVHLLVVPRKHIATVADIKDGDERLLAHMLKVAKDLADDEDLKWYKLLFNVGKGAGQEVFHIHLHVMGD